MAIEVADKKEKKEFFKSLRKRARKRRNPFSIMFELTYCCNFRCFHCYLPGSRREEKELSTKQVFSILEQLKDMGVYNIGFTGGEALLRKDIFEILNYANKCGFKYGLLTNGYLIDEETAKRLKQANVNKVDITFNALNPEIFDAATQVKGSFKRVKKAVEILNNKKIQVAIKSTCMSINKNELFSVSRYARRLGIPYRIDGEILPCRSGYKECADKFSLNAKEIYAIRRRVYPEMFENKNGSRSRPRRKKNRLFNCGVGLASFSLNPYGRMNLCLEIDYPGYNVLSEGVSACWEKMKRDVDNLNNAGEFVCSDCDLRKYCGWCPGRSFMETGKFSNCSDYFRARAKERKLMAKRRNESYG